jgi:glucose-6-phosphate isomerase
MNPQALWDRYKSHLCRVTSVGLSLDISRMNFDDGFFSRMEPAMAKAYAAMDALEKGAIANPDEARMVGRRAGRDDLLRGLTAGGRAWRNLAGLIWKCRREIGIIRPRVNILLCKNQKR